MTQQVEVGEGRRPTVVIIGAGFGGLFAARALSEQLVDVLLVDRNNYHTFTPLLYQVATSALDPGDIAHPVRPVFRGHGNVRFLLGEVTAIDPATQQLTVVAPDTQQQVSYDYLLVATGSDPTYFGNDEFRRYSFELRTLQDSIHLRNHVLELFERAVWTEDAALREALLTIVVVGGGPTGLETAGALYELYNHVLNQEYPHAKLHTRVILVEMMDHLLAPYPPKLQQSALEQIKSLGVEVLLGRKVVGVTATAVQLDNDTQIATHTLIWAAGMKASPLGQLLGVKLARGGRIPVDPTMQVTGLAHVYAVGDIAYLEDEKGQAYPMLIPVAQQQGKLAAHNILQRIQGEAATPFVYNDRGIMATIGRSRAVAWIYNRVALTGRLAWLAWLGLHLIMLLGFRNRINVFINWVWTYLTYDRSVRLILSAPFGESHEEQKHEGGE
ncbi:MAG: NAD(P)/FAD-dependent oxidoreductase [Caldilineaceae bacterium]